MLDIKFIRSNLDVVRAGAIKKHIRIDFDELVKLDDARLEKLVELEKLQRSQNDGTDDIKLITDDVLRAKKIEELQGNKKDLKKAESEYKSVLKKWKEIMMNVPNVPDMSVPDGKDDNDNTEIHSWGEETSFEFEPRDHIEIMKALNMVDFERGAKVHGFRGYFLENDAVLLSFAIWNYAMDFFGNKGFNPMITPAIVRKENFYGTGYLPNDAEDLFETQDGDYLSGTSEVAVMGYYAREVLPEDNFPIKKLAFSPCFRREAGSHGKDVKGLIRVHEFYKWEQVILCEASHEKSVELHEELRRNTEEFIESLNIPYRTVINCGGDLGLGQVKKYDVELWVPREEKYREIASVSYFHDFQTRRLNIRYKDGDGKMRFVHSLNSTAIPTPRILVSLVENFQQADGSIKIPQILQKYMGKDAISKIEINAKEE